MPYTIQADYNTLEMIERQFDREGQDVEMMLRRIRALVEQLEHGGWVGRGAQRFYDEMYLDVIPALRKLHDALYFGADSLMEIMRILHNAEEEAGRLFLLR